MSRLLTVDEAAAAGWGHRAALYDAIREGRIDAVGRRPAMIETSELERVYGAPKARPDHVDDIELDRLRRENLRLRGDLDGERRHGSRLREMAAGYARTGELPPLPSARLWSWLHGYADSPFASAPTPTGDHIDDLELERLRHENRRLRADVEAEREHGCELRTMAARYARTRKLPPLPSWRLWRWLHGYGDCPFGFQA